MSNSSSRSCQVWERALYEDRDGAGDDHNSNDDTRRRRRRSTTTTQDDDDDGLVPARLVLLVLLELLEVGGEGRPVLRVALGPDVDSSRPRAAREDRTVRVRREGERAVLRSVSLAEDLGQVAVHVPNIDALRRGVGRRASRNSARERTQHARGDALPRRGTGQSLGHVTGIRSFLSFNVHV